MDKETNILQKNISRLVKLAGDTSAPGQGFTDSLIDEALKELSRGGALPRGGFLQDRIDKMMAAAAAIAVICGAAIQILLSLLAGSSAVLAGALFLAMSANWLSYLGSMIL